MMEEPVGDCPRGRGAVVCCTFDYCLCRRGAGGTRWWGRRRAQHTQLPARVIQGVKFIMKMFSGKNKSAGSACFLPRFGSGLRTCRSAGDKEEPRAPSCAAVLFFTLEGEVFFVYTRSNITVKRKKKWNYKTKEIRWAQFETKWSVTHPVVCCGLRWSQTQLSLSLFFFFPSCFVSQRSR